MRALVDLVAFYLVVFSGPIFFASVGRWMFRTTKGAGGEPDEEASVRPVVSGRSRA